MFEYQAKLDRVVDGDTVDLHIDLGFSMENRSTRIRLADIDTHEIFFVDNESEEYKKGMEEKEFAIEWFDEANRKHDGNYPLVVNTMRDRTGKYGRYIAYIRRKCNGEEYTQRMLDEFGDDILYKE